MIPLLIPNINDETHMSFLEFPPSLTFHALIQVMSI